MRCNINNLEKIYDLDNLLPLDIQGWNGNCHIFKELINEIKPSIIIEVGSWKGQSAITMGNAVRDLNLKSKIYCIDTWLGALEFWVGELSHAPERDLLLKNGYPSIYYQFISNIIHCKLQDIIIPFPNTSLIGARYLKKINKKAELIYIDGSHDYEDVLLDMYVYYELLNSDGKMFGDDYNTWPDVKMAVDEFVIKNNLKLKIIDNFWLINKA